MLLLGQVPKNNVCRGTSKLVTLVQFALSCLKQDAYSVNASPVELTPEDISAIDQAGALGHTGLYSTILHRLVIAVAAAGVFWGASRLLCL